MTPPEHASPLNVALVGFGYAGKTIHAPLLQATEGLRLHTVVSSRPDDVRADLPDVRVVPDLEGALLDPAIQLVVIATPNVTHAPLARRALLSGRHVVIDKPFAASLEEARALSEIAERAGRLLSVFHNRRWDADFLTVQSLIAKGSLGEITRFESHFDRFRPHVRDRWRERPGPGAGIWFDLGAHLADQALHLFGRPLSVLADIATQRPGGGADDSFHVVLRYDRLRVILHGDCLTLANDLRFSAHGTGGSFVKEGLDPQEEALKAGKKPGCEGWGVDPRPGTRTTVVDGAPVRAQHAGEAGDYRAYYRAIRKAILGEGDNPVPAREALEVMELIEAARASAESGREVRL